MLECRDAHAGNPATVVGRESVKVGVREREREREKERERERQGDRRTDSFLGDIVS